MKRYISKETNICVCVRVGVCICVHADIHVCLHVHACGGQRSPEVSQAWSLGSCSCSLISFLFNISVTLCVSVCINHTLSCMYVWSQRTALYYTGLVLNSLCIHSVCGCTHSMTVGIGSLFVLHGSGTDLSSLALVLAFCFKFLD